MAKKKDESKVRKKFVSLDEMRDALDEEYGAGTIITGDVVVDCEVWSTGSVTLNKALGVGGIPKGRIIEIYGPEASGKTTLTLSIAAQCQKAGGTVAFIDAEHALDRGWASAQGVDMDSLLINQPDFGEQAIEIAESMAYSGQVDLIIIDSVAALIPQVELEGEMSDHNVGAQARMLSKGCRKIAGVCKKTNCTIIWINQLREKIGVMFGNPETTPGGRALKFYASVRLDIRRKKAIKDGDTNVGNEVKVKVVKNKVSPPFKEAEFAIYFGEGEYPSGVDYSSSLVAAATAEGIISKKGASHRYDGKSIGNGANQAAKFLRENADVADEIEEKVKATFSIATTKNLTKEEAPETPEAEEIETEEEEPVGA